MADRALVLGSGGVTGRAWEWGMLAGLQRAGVLLAAADLVIGTSAGAAVGAALASGVDPAEYYERELARPASGELVGRLGGAMLLRWARIGIAHRSGTPEALGQAFGRLAVGARTVTQERRLADLSTRLPGLHGWPRRLLITAVDAASGERVVLDEASDVSILTAVAASCAVPGVWPPVTVGGRRLIDGGIRSPANADLAAGCARVVVLAPTPAGFQPGSAATAQVAGFGDRAVVLAPDRTAKRAFGRDSLDPAHRAAAAAAGFAQAAQEAARVAEVWGDPGGAGEALRDLSI